jgi:molecular chaperone DnaK (HSP70)
MPSSFSPSQGDGILEAAQRAGFTRVQIVDEASAAALAHAAQSGNEQLVAVYDLGGGTFDLAVVRTDGTSQEVVAFGGDPYLGGDDIDACLARHIAQEVLTTYRWDLQASPDRFSRLLWACEQAKIALSSLQSTEVGLTQVDPMLTGKSIVVRRDFFEALVRGVVQRTFVLCDEVLARARVTTDRLDAVVLAGGGSHIPCVREAVASYFRSEPVVRVPPDKVVAVGAAMAAERLTVA